MDVYQGGSDYLYLTYAHADEEQVQPALQYLQNMDFRIWYPKSGDSEEFALWRMYCSKCVLAFASRRALADPAYDRAMDQAARMGKMVLVVYLDLVPKSPKLLKYWLKGWALLRERYETQEEFHRALGKAKLLRSCRIAPGKNPDKLTPRQCTALGVDYDLLESYDRALRMFRRGAERGYGPAFPVVGSCQTAVYRTAPL